MGTQTEKKKIAKSLKHKTINPQDDLKVKTQKQDGRGHYVNADRGPQTISSLTADFQWRWGRQNIFCPPLADKI